MNTIHALKEHADAQLFSGDYPRALHAYAALVQLQPNDLDARLRIGDTLLSMGEVQAAAFVYTTLARHAAHAGHPLRALVAMKILEALDPELGKLIEQFAELYHRDSPRLGQGVRLSLASESAALPEEIHLDTPPPLEELLPAAAKIAVDLGRIAAYPELLPPIPLLSELPQEAFARVLRSVSLSRKRPGEIIIQQGQPGTAFYVLARGVVGVARENADGTSTKLASLRDGALFGEMALVSAQARSATVVAEDDSDLLEFSRAALEAAASDIDTVAAALDKFTRERLLQNLLATSPLFRPLDRKQRLDLIRRFTAHDVQAGTHVIREGEPGRGLYLLMSGSVDVWKRDGDEKVLLATLSPGDVFGEISLVLEEPTSASVTAGEKSTVLFLSRELFTKLTSAVQEIREYVENLSDERLMDARLTMESSEIEIDDDDGLLI